jgi:hypothetical protein
MEQQMSAGPPENPPTADFNLPLVEHYPPHGFPPYLGLGLLDAESLRLGRGESVAEYRDGTDLVYRVRGTFDPAVNPGTGTACAAAVASWEIEEFFAGKPWRKTAKQQTLSQVFFHHVAAQVPTENPRVAALLRRLTEKYSVALRCKHQCSYLMFPAGYLYAIRLPLTDETFEPFKKWALERRGGSPVPGPTIGNPVSVAILKADAAFQARIERGVVSDVSVPAIRLTAALDELFGAGVVADQVHLRPEIIYANEGHRRFSKVQPGRLRDDVVTYQVIPVDGETPPAAELMAAFAIESAEIFYLVDEALRSGSPETGEARRSVEN